MAYKDKEKNKEYSSQWYHQNKNRLNTPLRKSRNALLAKKWRKENPEKKYLSGIKSRSKRSGLEFNLTIEDIVFPKICPILLIPVFITEGRQTDNTPAVDRIDNTKGYLKGNVQVISHKANRMKADMSVEDVSRLLKYMKHET